MNNFQIRKAGEVGIQPAYIKGKEKHGLCYFTWHDSEAVGGQCANCNKIIWVSQKQHPILKETKPDETPASGSGYQKYYKEKLKRFLGSLPSCPSCNGCKYDKFINNVSFPRFEDGSLFEDEGKDIELVNVEPNNVDVYWLK